MNKEFIDEYRFEFEKLQRSLKIAKSICPPDEYQMRQNALIQCMAEFLLIPYENFLKEEKK